MLPLNTISFYPNTDVYWAHYTQYFPDFMNEKEVANDLSGICWTLLSILKIIITCCEAKAKDPFKAMSPFSRFIWSIRQFRKELFPLPTEPQMPIRWDCKQQQQNNVKNLQSHRQSNKPQGKLTGLNREHSL